MKNAKQGGAMEVYRLLGLETEKDRQRLRQLAKLGQRTSEERQVTYVCADTRNNTRREAGDAELEPTS
jgi:hypothetical protein